MLNAFGVIVEKYKRSRLREVTSLNTRERCVHDASFFENKSRSKSCLHPRTRKRAPSVVIAPFRAFQHWDASVFMTHILSEFHKRVICRLPSYT
uniref:Uncharacterized protein n=1 Tax=Parascaris univalens TaxID=6257 RepID=A0A915A373_PARUN